MGDLICYRRYFSDIEKEEKWLNEMAEKGEFPKLHSDPKSLYEQEKKRFGQYIGISSVLLFDIAYILFEGIFDVLNEHTNWFTVVCIVCMVFAAVWLVFGIRGVIAAKRKMNELKRLM